MPSLPVASEPMSPVRRRPLHGRVAAGHVVMVLAGLLAFLLAYGALRDRSTVVDIVIAAADIPAGARLEPALVSTVSLGLSRGTVPTGLMTGPEAKAAMNEGLTLAVAVPSGSVLRSSDIALPGTSRSRTMALPVDRAHAVDGDLVPGDLIDIVQVSDGVARFVLSAVPVLDVSDGTAGGARGLTLTVEVDAPRSLQLAQAMAQGSLEIVRSTGASPIEPRSNAVAPIAGRDDE